MFYNLFINKIIFTLFLACKNNGDILFILDASASVGHANFMTIKNYVQKLVNATNVVDDGARIALISYNNVATLQFQLGAHKSRTEVNDAIQSVSKGVKEKRLVKADEWWLRPEGGA